MDYLCDVGMTRLEFLREHLLHLVWWKLGSLNEILELPLSIIYRTKLCLQEDSVSRTFRILRGDVGAR